MKFNRGDLLIPKGKHYPEGAVIADGYDDAGRLMAHPAGGGLQYYLGAEAAAELRVVDDAEQERALFRRARFVLADSDETFEGWSNGRLWNGWDMPRFERSEAERLIKWLGDERARFDAEHDGFITFSQDGEEEEVWAAENVVISDGSKVTVYGVGAGAWIWDEVEPKESSVGAPIKNGARITYNDGRPGHIGVVAVVLAVDAEGMTVQFEDRADTTYIRFTDRRWMDFISVNE